MVHQAAEDRYDRYSPPAQGLLKKIRALKEIAAERGQTLAWVLKDREISSVLIGASAPEQIRENVQVINHTKFTDEELFRIDEISLNQGEDVYENHGI
ncbi:MAG TPA: aldo/keto reductase [Candidatus Bariatricus faecipullorum]|nr:aldo/keto reductase [Candidatus Bariatricus faecipullorum]